MSAIYFNRMSDTEYITYLEDTVLRLEDELDAEKKKFSKHIHQAAQDGVNMTATLLKTALAARSTRNE